MAKRYFINQFSKSKFSSFKINGNPKCIFCGNDKILDLHHIYTYIEDSNPNPWSGRNLIQEKVDKIIFVCPNHHYVYHRLIDTQWAFRDFFEKNYPKLMFDVNLIRKRIIELETTQIPYYKKPIIESGRIGRIIMNDRILKRYGDKEGGKILNKNGEALIFKAGAGKRYSYAEEKKWFEDIYLNQIPNCVICGYKTVLDGHHIYKDGKIFFFCPNHHYMIHRILGDRNGDKLSLEEIKKGIALIEKQTKSYFKEVSDKEYLQHKGYYTMKIKE